MISIKTRSLYFLLSYTAAAFIVALIVTPLMRHLAFCLGAVDRGSGRRVHQGVVPRLGGIAIYLAIVAPLLVLIATSPHDLFNHKLLGVILAGTLVFLAGFFDDLRGLSARVKLSVEILAAAMLYIWGVRIALVTNPFGGSIELGLLSLPVTVLWIIVICNAINLVDGLDGLAAGTGILITVMLVLFSVTRPAAQYLVPLVVAAALLGFLRYNYPPATIFMGDSGSLFLGFFLAAASILFSSKATAMATVMVPVVMFAHPIMDMGYAVLRRIYRGVPLGQPDREHIHHKLLDMGLSRRLVLTVLVVMDMLLLLGSWFVVHRQRGSDFILLALLVVMFLAGLRLFGYVNFGQFFGEDFKVLLVSRKRRYVLFLVRRFEKQVVGIQSLEDLKSPVLQLLAETGYDEVVVTLKLDRAVVREFVFNVARVAGEGVRTSFPVVRDGREVGRLELVAAAGSSSPVDAAEIAAAVSEAVLKVVDAEANFLLII